MQTFWKTFVTYAHLLQAFSENIFPGENHKEKSKNFYTPNSLLDIVTILIF